MTSLKFWVNVIKDLQKSGIVGRELCPVQDGYGGTAYWHWEVLQPDRLPPHLKVIYKIHGEVRL